MKIRTITLYYREEVNFYQVEGTMNMIGLDT